MKITSHRKLNGEHDLRDETGEVVGSAWPFRIRSCGFGLGLHGIYWRADGFNTRGGNTATSCKTLSAAREKAAEVLTILRARAAAAPSEQCKN